MSSARPRNTVARNPMEPGKEFRASSTPHPLPENFGTCRSRLLRPIIVLPNRTSEKSWWSTEPLLHHTKRKIARLEGIHAYGFCGESAYQVPKHLYRVSRPATSDLPRHVNVSPAAGWFPSTQSLHRAGCPVMVSRDFPAPIGSFRNMMSVSLLGNLKLGSLFRSHGTMQCSKSRFPEPETCHGKHLRTSVTTIPWEATHLARCICTHVQVSGFLGSTISAQSCRRFRLLVLGLLYRGSLLA